MFHVFVVWLALGVALTAGLQAEDEMEWETYEAEAFNIRFDVPASWKVAESEETFVASPESGGISYLIVAAEEETTSEELFASFANDVELKVEEEPEDIGPLNGFQAWVGGGTATVDGADVLVLAAALTRGTTSVVAYFFCEPALAEQYQPVMLDALQRIYPLDLRPEELEGAKTERPAETTPEEPASDVEPGE